MLSLSIIFLSKLSLNSCHFFSEEKRSYSRNKRYRLTLDSTSYSIMISSIPELFPVIENLVFCLKKQTFPSVMTTEQYRVQEGTNVLFYFL